MTEVPPTDAPETPAQAEAKRTWPRRAAFIVGGVFAGLLALLIVGFVGGRTYLRSDSGRAWVTRLVDGQKLSRYGRLHVEGLRGDLFDDFTLGRVTVTDANGVWLEATDVRVDWSYGPLLLRRFHAQDISAARIRLIRRPVVEPSTEPSKPMPLGVDVDRFSADVELEEGFSREYGRWRLTGSAAVPRKGSKTAEINAYSLTRRGDYLRATATFGGEAKDLRLNLRANEAQGGPIAGALGYSPDRPFSAVAVVNGEIVDARVTTGRYTPLIVRGRYGAAGTRISGFFDFSGSDLLAPLARRVGPTARFGFPRSRAAARERRGTPPLRSPRTRREPRARPGPGPVPTA